jgi:hypothetical protein
VIGKVLGEIPLDDIQSEMITATRTDKQRNPLNDEIDAKTS